MDLKLAKKISEKLTPSVLKRGATLYVAKEKGSFPPKIEMYCLEYCNKVVLSQNTTGEMQLFTNLKRFKEFMGSSIEVIPAHKAIKK